MEDSTLLRKLREHSLSREELIEKGFRLLSSNSNDFAALEDYVKEYNIKNFPLEKFRQSDCCDCGKKHIVYKFYATNNFQHSSRFKKENFLLLGSNCKKLLDFHEDEENDSLSDEESYFNYVSRSRKVTMQTEIQRYYMDEEIELEEEDYDDSFIDDRSESELTIESEDSLLDD